MGNMTILEAINYILSATAVGAFCLMLADAIFFSIIKPKRWMLRIMWISSLTSSFLTLYINL